MQNDQPKTGAELIAAERQRQIDVEGWTLELDDDYPAAALLAAGLAYLDTAHKQLHVGDYAEIARIHAAVMPANWPWDREWWKPSDQPQRNMEKGGALVAAAIDRLKRAKT